MIRIKEIAGDTPQSENFGRDYMAQISRSTARALCGMYPVPAMAYETIVAVNVTSFSRPRLFVANISGAYFVRCAGVAIEAWPETFGVSVQRKEANYA